MFKKLLAIGIAIWTSLAMAATVDVNKATQAQLTEIKGIGAATATRILEARKQGSFKNWDDLIDRVKGIATTSASKMSASGLTVNGQSFPSPATTLPAQATSSDKSAKPAQTTSKKPEKS